MLLFFFNELDLLQHIKHEHQNTWSPRHKYTRANITNVEIPEEMSLFAEVKIFTEDVHERGFMLLSMAHSSAEGGSQGGAEEPHQTTSQESSNELEKEKQQEDTDAGVMNLANPGAAEALCTTGVAGEDLETATKCTLFVRTKRERHRDRNAAIRILRTGTDDAKFLELSTWIKTWRHPPTHAKSERPRV